VGDGPAMKSLKQIAGPTIDLTGHRSGEEVEELMGKARAFIFSAEEDFGIVNVEAQAAGIPVIAFGRGGALETVIDGKTGLFFRKQTPECIIETVKEFIAKEDTFNPHEIRKNAERFPRSRFEREFKAFVDEAWDKFPYK
jgi:glycosyltransferase involved in cell wall biosynthesis